MQNRTDVELIELINSRNTNALKELYSRYNLNVYNFVLRYTNNKIIAEDILQETFTRVWFASHTFNPIKGLVKTWIFTIALNITRNEMSLKRYAYNYVDIEEITVDDPENLENLRDNPINILENLETKDRISKALEKLNPFFKEVVLLKHFQELKFREISEMTNTPEGTLKARFHKALIMLRKILQEEK
ncbi:MAG TPA: sigma-70 family RNA polymerase sigma factor [Melioribacteraceae bacterium]|nr:sigma-70 family RNA polymerase sigma factor [Melioribacteraceae bacterium]